MVSLIMYSVMQTICYSLASLTETGFQKLINVTNEYITSHGLRFQCIAIILTLILYCQSYL